MKTKQKKKNAISGASLKQYLVYSLGEILLVVIGILIAVQINNWNEAKKSKINEVFILNEILSNLEKDDAQLKTILQQREKTQTAILRMGRYLKTPQRISADSLSYDLAQLLTFERYFPIRTSYEVAKMSGLKISNQRLRSGIADYYEFEQNRIQKSLLDVENTFLNSFPSIPSDHYFIEKYGESVALQDYQDPAFITSIEDILSYFIPNHSGTLQKLYEFEQANAVIRQRIEGSLANPVPVPF